MIAEGRSKLEWERKIPDEKLGELKSMLEASDFKEKLGKVIKRIYELAWEQVIEELISLDDAKTEICLPTFHSSLTCPEVITRTTRCTSWHPRP